MTSSDCLSSNNQYRPRLSSVSRLNLPTSSVTNVTDDLKRTTLSTTTATATPTTPNSTSPNMYFTPLGSISTQFSQLNAFSSCRPTPLAASSSTLLRPRIAFKPPEQEMLDRSFFNTFNMEQNDMTTKQTSDMMTIEGIFSIDEISEEFNMICFSKKKKDSTSNSKQTDSPNLIDMGTEPVTQELLTGTVFELFDPLKQTNRPHSWPTELNQAGTNSHTSTPVFVTPNNEDVTSTAAIASSSSTSSLTSYPYPIKLRLRLAIFPEIKPFSQLVQKICNENKHKQVNH
jgi:hypothetical protein